MKLSTTIALSILLAFSVSRAKSLDFQVLDLQQFRKTLPCFDPVEAESPSQAPSESPSKPPTEPPDENTFIIYATGDVPYTDPEVVNLKRQIPAIPKDAELFLHVGDIRRSTTTPCTSTQYEFVRGILNQSAAPLLLVLGDNEWNDCTNIPEAYALWHTHFGTFENHWPSLKTLVVRDQMYPEVFSLVQKGVLVIGLNLVGGLVHNTTEWQTRLTYQANKVQELIMAYWGEKGNATKVILVGHADPKPTKHAAFFGPLKDFIANTTQNQFPIMYLNGDAHLYKYEPNYLGQPSLLRVMVQGGAIEAPLRIQVNLDAISKDPAIAFTVLRNSYPF